MPLETTMLCLDNSEFMRNADYIPSRLEALCDAANVVANAKMNSNPENTVGVMSLAGRNPELLVSPTDDMGKIMTSIHDVELSGLLSFADGVQIAYLALKHRRNKNGGQRIVVFVGSPVSDEVKKLSTLAKMLRKNEIAVDVVSIGEIEDNQEKLEEFVKTVDKNNNSNLVSIPPGCVPSDMLYSSPIINENAGGNADASFGFGAGGAPAGAAGAAGGAGGGNDDFGGVDPNMDPELAMALRVSMEEERARQETEAAADPAAEAGAAAAASGSGGMDVEDTSASTPATAAAPAPAPVAGAGGGGEAEDEELLQQALALSMNDGPSAPETMDTDGMDEEMMMALQMSMQVDAATPSASEAAPASGPAAEVPDVAGDAAASAAAVDDGAGSAGAAGGQFHDASFVTNMLASLPGVDPSDPRIQQALQQIQNSKDAEKKDDKDSK